MQELMSRHKTTSFSPRDCLKTILHQRWSKTCSGKNRISSCWKKNRKKNEIFRKENKKEFRYFWISFRISYESFVSNNIAMSNSSCLRYSANLIDKLNTLCTSFSSFWLNFVRNELLNWSLRFSKDTRPPAKPRRKRKSTTATTPTNANANNLSTGKDPNFNNCSIPTPTKKRSPANTVYSQSSSGSMTPNMTNLPGVGRIELFRYEFFY